MMFIEMEEHMETPKMMPAQKIDADTTALISYYPLPGLGVLPVNSFVIHAKEPVLIDTTVGAIRSDYLQELTSVIDPEDLRWIWLTHIDADHIGNLRSLLSLAPNAHIVTSYLGMGKLSLLDMPLDRIHLLNPGQRLSAGDRELLAVHPPVFDAPETQGVLDLESGILFSSDCFGGLLQTPEESLSAISTDALRQGMITWATIDAPWLHSLDRRVFDSQLQAIRTLRPQMVLSSHLLPATSVMLDQMCGNLSEALTAPVFVGPDQAALMRMMAV
jgi:glyoxylase-like metal-dependent hydrolase (beta-lactamase superfamily II)